MRPRGLANGDTHRGIVSRRNEENEAIKAINNEERHQAPYKGKEINVAISNDSIAKKDSSGSLLQGSRH